MKEFQVLYNQLYEKYQKLKTEKESELEKRSQEQELKFLEFVSIAENAVKSLTDENKKLKAKIDDLIDSNRTTEDQYSKFQKLWAEEKQKTKELSGEVEALHKLIPEGFQRNNMNETNYDGKLRSPLGSSKVSPERNQKPHNCCGSHQTYSGDDVNDIGRVNCLFQTLIQCLVGMKFSVVDQAGELSVSVLHQSSGYSFSLTLLNCSGDEAELLYHVTSLGTFDRVAPEWMREEIVFGMNMCPVFFERVSWVTKGHC
ncbi:uncharacterized protein [Aristolochia californica]|uniref:uncharacterized protein isoform X2 n=1 Tax=Aristolochia californica TaxID=171875 RepID=UPI0035DF0738